MKWIINLPEQVKIENGTIAITGNVGWSVIEKSVHNAVPYEAPKETKEQGEAGLRELGYKVSGAAGFINGVICSGVLDKGTEEFAKNYKADLDYVCLSLYSAPAPVASGLREEIEEILKTSGKHCSDIDEPTTDFPCLPLERISEALSRHPSTPQAEKVDRTEELVKKLVNIYHDGCGCECCQIVEKEIKEALADYDKGAK